MALKNTIIRPGINKTDTPSGAEGQWIDADNIRFRYSQPEKIGGWQAIGQETFAGPARDQHTWSALDGKKYAALGTSQILAVYYEDKFYDITPLDTAITIASNAFVTVSGSSLVTVIASSSHNLAVGRYIRFSAVGSLPGGYIDTDFTTDVFEVLTVPTATTFTIDLEKNANASATSGTATITPYVSIGPTFQTYGYGWGTETWGGEDDGATSTTLNGEITDIATTITLTDASAFPTSGSILIRGTSSSLNGGITDSATSLTLIDASTFPSQGIIFIGDEKITYSGKSSNDLTGLTRGVDDTPATAHGNTATVITRGEIITYTGKSTNDLTGCVRGQESTEAVYHATGSTVINDDEFNAWGEETDETNVVLEPGSWSLDNFGEILVATIKDGRTFSWNPGVSNPLDTRAVVISGAPTSSRLTVVSDRDRHLFHFGTEQDIGDPNTQDPMFIRFSDQESLSNYLPTATNTAGTFRLDAGNKIVAAVSGKDYVLVLTDTAAYVMQFVGPPFTFSIRQVGTNCGCIGQHAVAFANGNVYWMGLSGGFFVYDGTVKILPSLVEDFVFTTRGNNPGVNFNSAEIIYAAHNSLYNEIVWFYPTATPLGNPAIQNNRGLIYNYVENVWSINTLSRTTYADSGTYNLPYATSYSASAIPQFPVIKGATDRFGASTYFAHETGVNEVGLNSNPVPIEAYIQSGDFDLTQGGDGEFMLHIRRFLPDFKNLIGSADVILNTKDYSKGGNTTTSSFTVQPTTNKVDTRVRGRFASIKVENTSLNDNWRYGTFRVDIQPDGRK